MQVGDLVTIADWGDAGQVGKRPIGIVVCFDPEEIGDPNEVCVKWTRSWCGMSYHSDYYLEVVNENR